ncbi:helix-turn-helix transcriptional regulator [Streptomyces sp. SL13]|uniref:Helix-turn-helix transcriptional regulator n=1 Tax=Streptantibioticus silvisoli TaxID=2705255 RepID=A0AA90H5W1_9ACTN|nr:helix-turn-helix transcriptional regulator [Streptantibioticus silvisoli]MDI5969380.1 helix-turn-helix transcriptional regulator [Streptantibioticus silvisoli]
MTRNLQRPPTGRPYRELADRLTHLRTTARLTQRELAASIGVSRGAVQRAEAGTTAPSTTFLDRYITSCRGTPADRAAVAVLRAAGRATERGRLPGLDAPAPAHIRTRADLSAALAAAYEKAGAPPLRDFARRSPAGGAPIPLAGASRIKRRDRLPSTAGQLETWLEVCGVPHHQRQHYRDAYATLTTARPRRIPARRPHAARGAGSSLASLVAIEDHPIVITGDHTRTLTLTGPAYALAQHLHPKLIEEILLTGLTRLTSREAHLNGGGYQPDLLLTTPAGHDTPIAIELKSSSSRPGTPPPPMPPAAAPAGTGPRPGNHPPHPAPATRQDPRPRTGPRGMARAA